ncbi:MAG: aldo/keto reductase [Oscillospiraceae bacterium]|nr:aldo/keto reductase [Oscillospiraceae bacterium]
MVYRKHNNNNLSLLGFGFLRLPLLSGKPGVPVSGDEIDYEHLQTMVDYSIENGINFFDTSHVYTDGYSEIALGQALKKHDRSKVYISTKMTAGRNRTVDEMSAIFDAQLERLQTDYIDYYLFHNIRNQSWDSFKQSGLWDFLCKKKKEGQVRHIGFSFHGTTDLLREVVEEYDFELVMLQLNYLDWIMQSADEQYKICAEKNIPIAVMEPVRGGALAKWPDDINPPKNEMSPASYAIRWVASLPKVVCVLSGMSNMEHVRDNVKTMQEFKPISDGEQEFIDDVVRKHLLMDNIPCTACGYCVPHCPKKIEISRVFPLYNDNIRSSRWTSLWLISSEDRFNIDCIKCNQCLPHCPQNISIPGELEKMQASLNILQKENRHYFTEYIPHGEVILYGAGVNAALMLKAWKSQGLHAVCFADADNAKHYTRFNETCYEILPPLEAISHYPNACIYIALAQNNFRSAVKYLIEIGFPEERIF